MSFLDGLRCGDCSVDGASRAGSAPFRSATVDPARIGSFGSASRKRPEFMWFRLVQCPTRATVYNVGISCMDAIGLGRLRAENLLTAAHKPVAPLS